MTAEVEVYLDDTPGEVRGIVSRDGRFERMIIHREADPPEHRLGARLVGRIIRSEPAFRAAFVDMGREGPAGFLPLKKGETARDGEAVEVEVTAEPRGDKGPSLRRLGPAAGGPRLLAEGPDVLARLAALAPGVTPGRGIAAIQASWDAEEEALTPGDFFAEWGLDLAVQRTRALVAVDVDYRHLPGRDARKGRAQANAMGLIQAARMIRLKGWGGLVVIDLVGTALDQTQIVDRARDAFEGDGASLGPLSRFGLLQLALPWTVRPLEEILQDEAGRRTVTTQAIDVTRHLRHALLSDTAAPRWTVTCDPGTAAAAAPLVARLGPRAALRTDPALAIGRFAIQEG